MYAAAFLALTLPVAAPKLKEKAPPGPEVVGRWLCTALDVDGRGNPQWQGLEYEFTADGKWVIYRNGQVIDSRARTYKLDPKAGPTAIDVDEGVPRPPSGWKRTSSVWSSRRTAEIARPVPRRPGGGS